jgi:hypothetical protein
MKTEATSTVYIKNFLESDCGLRKFDHGSKQQTYSPRPTKQMLRPFAW